MQMCHIRTLLTHAVLFAKTFMVFDCSYVNHEMEYLENGFGLKSACF